METTIVADNTKGQVLAFDGKEQVGQLDFTFKGQVMSIDHTQAFKKSMGIGALLVEAANEYAINHKLEAKHAPIISNIVERHESKGAMQSLYLRDPDGNLVELSSYLK